MEKNKIYFKANMLVNFHNNQIKFIYIYREREVTKQWLWRKIDWNLMEELSNGEAMKRERSNKIEWLYMIVLKVIILYWS